MNRLKSVLLTSSAAVLFAASANAGSFNIPGGTLTAALDAYSAQSGVQIAISSDNLQDVRSKGVAGEMSPETALSRLLSGTGFTARKAGNAIAVVRAPSDHSENVIEGLDNIQLAQAAAPHAAVETVTVTSSKLGGADVQSIPISITALSQEQLTASQTAGGPDLIKQVPNMTFTKTNFSGYSIQLRGIGTQAISVTTDPAVAVAFNDIPFIRNHFFEQEFYDVSQVEVLRGPQGTLYGRNATAGVVNLISAKPTDQFEAMASADIGDYKSRRFEGMINLPIVDDRLDIRMAGEWTKRDGYSFNQITDSRIDGRDLWSSRLSIGIKPLPGLSATLVWEHFQEDDDRLRSSKQLCKTDPLKTSVDGVPVPPIGSNPGFSGAFEPASYLSQSCQLTSLYSNDAFEVPEGFSLPYIKAAKLVGFLNPTLDPYASTTQSPNLRVIESTVDPHYKARNDTVELNADYALTPALTLTSQTGYNQDFLFSTEDYNRFNTSSGIFVPITGRSPHFASIISPDGVFCDPQVGCADRVVGVDLSDENAWQLSQEIRVTSNFSGPLNFSFGGNYLHYETEENYYVFINALTLYTLESGDSSIWVPGVSDNHACLFDPSTGYGYIPRDPRTHTSTPSQNQCNYIDPNPIGSLNTQGHNYFVSQNPYLLNSYAGFGEVYYNVTSDLKLTGGLRWTDDRKHFVDIPSELLTDGYGYFITGIVDQSWQEFTGRTAVNWTPKLDFTDQTLVYASYAHGYKAGGANPPGAALIGNADGNTNYPIHPLTFAPEFIDAYELGTKNTLLDGGLTLNGDVFFYNYKGYQISRIVDRTAINDNFNATVKGAEVEASWEPTPGLRFKFSSGWEATRVDNGQSSIDLMDRTAGNTDWIVVRPYPTQASNCILPTYVVSTLLNEFNTGPNKGQAAVFLAEACGVAYNNNEDPLTYLPYAPGPNLTSCTNCSINGQRNQNPPAAYLGFDPLTAPNNGEGFAKDLSGNELPNAPKFTGSLSMDYTLPVTADWAATAHGDLYWQSRSWARIFNDNPYDRIHGYTNLNLALILTNQSGWQVMGYIKNVFNTTAITGDFLNSDDSGLTTNVFLTDPRLYGIRITKNW